MSLRFCLFRENDQEYYLLGSGGKDKYIRLYKIYDSKKFIQKKGEEDYNLEK